jgi:hypothetical protein
MLPKTLLGRTKPVNNNFYYFLRVAAPLGPGEPNSYGMQNVTIPVTEANPATSESSAIEPVIGSGNPNETLVTGTTGQVYYDEQANYQAYLAVGDGINWEIIPGGVTADSDIGNPTSINGASGQIYISNNYDDIPEYYANVGGDWFHMLARWLDTVRDRPPGSAAGSTGDTWIDAVNGNLYVNTDGDIAWQIVGTAASQSGIGDPNGSITGTAGQIYNDTDGGVQYVNTDGGTVWVSFNNNFSYMLYDADPDPITVGLNAGDIGFLCVSIHPTNPQVYVQFVVGPPNWQVIIGGDTMEDYGNPTGLPAARRQIFSSQSGLFVVNSSDVWASPAPIRSLFSGAVVGGRSATFGNRRGEDSLDIQAEINDATVASGDRSTAIGAYHNTASGEQSVAVGASNLASGVSAVAVGVASSASGDSAAALGVGAVARVNNTTNLGGPIITRADGGDGGSGLSGFQNYNGAKTTISTLLVDFKIVADGTTTLPSGCHFFPESFGVISEFSTSVFTPPTVRSGNESGPATLLAAVSAAGLTTQYSHKPFTTLLTNKGCTQLTAGVTVAASGTTSQGRFYWTGLLVEDEFATLP